MKKIVALVLSLVMVLGLATTAFGAITLWAPNGETVDCDVFDGTYNTKLNATAEPVAVTYNPGKALTLDKYGMVKYDGVLPHYTVEDYVAYYVIDVTVEDLVSTNDGTYYAYDADKAAAYVEAFEDDLAEFFYVADAEDTYADFIEDTFPGGGLMFGFQADEDLFATEIEIIIAVGLVADAKFVQVNSIPADADASQYIFVKKHNPLAKQGYALTAAQTAKDPYTILKFVYAVTYQDEGTLFTAWSDDCEAYAEPANADTVNYVTLNKGIKMDAENYFFAPFLKWGLADEDESSDEYFNVLVDGVVYSITDDFVAATAHTWVASAWDAKKNVTEYTCFNCKVVGTVINASINAPAGAKIDKLPNGTLVAYTFPVVEAPAGDKVESAQTFDAGIAMYVGMSVMAAAGSAVVLKKKD